MKIKMVKTACGRYGTFSEGHTYEVSHQVAKEFIEGEAAVALEPLSPRAVVSAQAEARELQPDAERAVAAVAPERTTRNGATQTADATKVPGAKREKRG